MAQTEDFVTRNKDLGTGDLDASGGRSSREIRSEIDRTRSDMDETFAALDAKLTPKEIGLELWNLFKGGSSTGANKLWQVTREHPMPAAVIGLGLGWLMVESSRKSESDRYSDQYDGRYRDYGRGSYRQGYASSREGFYTGSDFDEETGPGALSAAKDKVLGVADSAKDKVKDVAGSARHALSNAGDKVSDATDWTKEHASELGNQVSAKATDLKYTAKRQVRRAKTGFWQTMEANPLMVGAATLALGVIAGLAIPSTDKEDELMGETRDHLFEEVKEAGQQALDKGKHVAEAVADKVKEEARNQGLTAEGVADKVKNVAKEATNTVKEEAKRQNLVPEALAGKPDQPGQQAQGQPQPFQPGQPAGQQQQPQPAHQNEPELVKR